MARRRHIAAIVACAAAAAGTLAACGSQGVEVASDSPQHEGAVLFSDHCSGCHTLDSAGAEGSATKVRDRERVDGPNFNQRKETASQVLYAIRNGGFSGAIMPENIVVGDDAQKIADYLAKYSGKDAKSPKSPQQGSGGGQQSEGATPGNPAAGASGQSAEDQ